MVTGKRGTTLIEAVIAVAVVAIVVIALLQALGVATYDTLDTNLKTSALNLAKSQLEYVKSQSYINATGNLSSVYPMISNMSSNGNYTISGYVSYVNASNPSLQEITVNVSYANGKQVQIIGYKNANQPSSLTYNYTFCDNSTRGKTRWAWARTWTYDYLWSLGIQVTGNPPDFSKFISPTVYLTSNDSHPLYYATSNDYNGTCSSDASGNCVGSGECSNSGNYWQYTDSACWDLGWDTQLFTIKIDQTSVSNLSITWKGHGDSSAGTTFYYAVCIWNATSQKWYNPPSLYIATPVISGCGIYDCTFYNYGANITTNATNFVDATGNVSILTVSRRDVAKTAGIYTDYISLTVPVAPVPITRALQDDGINPLLCLAEAPFNNPLLARNTGILHNYNLYAEDALAAVTSNIISTPSEGAVPFAQ